MNIKNNYEQVKTLIAVVVAGFIGLLVAMDFINGLF